ncbi:iron ABC transporter permease (plasmid) [Bartonella sp. HY329]|uniref:FecCD family ABC transporter permease n=1 Tax=unclassified Bartonella TaxID=2645622 RepID=UPI0021C846B5|nr:iron ABC transporter permease [Bartonella sp. HY329]UXN10991.1 iron ABC transporter permease [Bartonella sp. HY328]
MSRLIFLCLLLFGVIILALMSGHYFVSPNYVLHALFQPNDLESQLLLVWRLPRVLTAALVGALLGLSGAIFQGVFRNPLAEPYLLGASGGAAIGATIALLVPLGMPSGSALALFSFLGALGSTWLVLLIAGLNSNNNVANLLLAGIALAAILGAVRSFLMLALSDDSVNLQVVLSWTLGGIQTTDFQGVILLFLLVIICLGITQFLARGLDLLGLGEEQAFAFGLNSHNFIKYAILIAAAVIAIAVSFGGLVGFIGLISPHIARWLVGVRHHIVLLASALIGAILVTICDAMARSILPPAEVPLGLITAIIGGPFFLLLLSQRPKS